ncbi:MAG: hypothetical protein HKP42_09405 [Maribacter sp.]|nr:hypothetical protein [Maribacter sp.]
MKRYATVVVIIGILGLPYPNILRDIYALFIKFQIAQDLFCFELKSPNQFGFSTFNLMSTQRITTKQIPMTIEFIGLIGVSLSYLKRRYNETMTYIEIKMSDAKGLRRNFILTYFY